MDFSSHLLPSAIKSMCAGAKQTLKVDNALYSSQLSYLDSFISDSSNNSPGIAQFKTHLGDYKLIIQGLVSSNDLDHADYIALENSVGDEELIGKDILTAKIAAENKRDLYNSIADGYERDAANVEWYEGWLAIAYLCAARKYRGWANEQDRIYQEMLAKEMFFDDVCSTTASLFTNSASIRSQATLGISEVLKVYGLKPVAVSSSTWKSALQGVLKDVEHKVVATIYLNHDPSLPFSEEEQMMIDKALDGLSPKNVFEILTPDERAQYVEMYEKVFPEHADSMNHIRDQFDTDKLRYVGWEEDITNIKFMAYTASEPYKSVYLNNISNITIVDLNYTGTQFFRGGEGVYLNHTKMDTNKASSYNTFFHETSHGIDYYIGTQMGYDGMLSRNYSVDGITMTDTLRQEVQGRIEFYIEQYYIDEYELTTGKKYTEDVELNIDSSVSDIVIDNILNQIDHQTYGDPQITNVEASMIYKYVQTAITGELVGTAKDTYGAFSGNTFCVKGTGGYHPALINEKGKIDDAGNKIDDYRYYWINDGYTGNDDWFTVNKDGTGLRIKLDDGTEYVSSINMKDTNLQELDGKTYAEIIIAADGNLVFTTSAACEYWAEEMAWQMTQENGNERAAREYFSDETQQYFLNMVDYALEYK